MSRSCKKIEKPKHCFCHIPLDDLKKYAEKKYIGHEETMDMLSHSKDSYEKELISIVALLDLDEETIVKTLGHLTKPGCHLSRCRGYVKDWIMHLMREKQKE